MQIDDPINPLESSILFIPTHGELRSELFNRSIKAVLEIQKSN